MIKQLKVNQTVKLTYDSNELEFNNLKIDLVQNIVTKNGMDIYLTKSEFQVIKLLSSHPGQVFSKEQLFEIIWNEKSESCLYAVENMISRIRKKIEDDPSRPQYILTVYGYGYKFTKKRIRDNL
ncbi:MAG: response regulator transcription factor [Thomasclavelia ramosa]|nr:response regulator transcription factor [Thomasclavelia ramosa]